jgi:dienelactone hydrolase
MMFFVAKRRCCGRTDSVAVRILAIVFLVLALAGALIVLLPGRAAAQAASPAASPSAPAVREVAILILRGDDTLVVERIRRDAGRVSAVIGMVGQPRVSLEYTLGADHLITGGSFALRGPDAPPDATPLQSGSMTFVGDSVVLGITGGGQSRELRRPAPHGTLPIANNDFVVGEQAVRRARALGVTTLDLRLFALANGQLLPGTIELLGTDSARFSVMGNVTTLAIDAEGNVTGGAIPAQGLRVVVLAGDAARGVRFGRPDYSAPPGAPYTAEEVTVRTKAGHVLAGTLTLPAGASSSAKVPAVITITGSGQQDRDELLPFAGGVRLFRQVADTLGRRGIAVLRLDDRGIGGSGGDVTGTSADFADDIRAGVDYLRARTEVDPARVALVGHSEGGMIAPMIAAGDPRLAAIALMAGTAHTGRRIIDYQLANLVRGNPQVPAAARDSVARVMLATFDSTEARKPWMRYFLGYDPIPTIRRVRQPVLILQGETDQQVRPEEARMLDAALREAGNRQVTLRLFPARNHLFLRDPNGHPGGYAALTDGRVDGEVLGALADWLAVTLAAAR